ncbi:hypothetical protein TRVL_09005 [Trypanosoma vivax]|nr:hypothetical protein TRVL_09005 [Trypanosoma vivax]
MCLHFPVGAYCLNPFLHKPSPGSPLPLPRRSYCFCPCRCFGVSPVICRCPSGSRAQPPPLLPTRPAPSHHRTIATLFFFLAQTGAVCHGVPAVSPSSVSCLQNAAFPPAGQPPALCRSGRSPLLLRTLERTRGAHDHLLLHGPAGRNNCTNVAAWAVVFPRWFASGRLRYGLRSCQALTGPMPFPAAVQPLCVAEFLLVDGTGAIRGKTRKVASVFRPAPRLAKRV